MAKIRTEEEKEAARQAAKQAKKRSVASGAGRKAPNA